MLAVAEMLLYTLAEYYTVESAGIYGVDVKSYGAGPVRAPNYNETGADKNN